MTGDGLIQKMMLSEKEEEEEEEVVKLLEVFWTGTGTWGSRDDVGLLKLPLSELHKNKYIFQDFRVNNRLHCAIDAVTELCK